jgi:triosephosphate isomerase (TIM)
MTDKAIRITPPFFEVGPKTYSYGKDILALAQFADQLSEAYGVQIIFTPQYVDIPLLAQGTDRVLVFAQHMDSLRPGRGIGAVLPEALKAAGAVGALLNHSEKRLSLPEIERTIQRAKEVGLATMVCADSLADVAVVARMRPDVVLAEPPELIEGGKRDVETQAVIGQINRAVWAVDPAIRVLHGAGISSEKDVYDVICQGAEATGTTSAVFKAADPFLMLEKMIRAVSEAWRLTHGA